MKKLMIIWVVGLSFSLSWSKSQISIKKQNRVASKLKSKLNLEQSDSLSTIVPTSEKKIVRREGGNSQKILAGSLGTFLGVGAGVILGYAIGGGGYDGAAGALIGGAVGSFLGPSLVVYRVGSSRGQNGSFGMTTLGGLVGLIGGGILAIPTLGLSMIVGPAVGATIGYNLSDSSVKIGGLKTREFGPKGELSYQMVNLEVLF